MKWAVLSIPTLTSYPYIALLSGFMLAFTLNCASVVKNVLSVSILTSTFMLQNKAVDQRQRGAAFDVNRQSNWSRMWRSTFVLVPEETKCSNSSRHPYDIFHIERDRGNWSSADVQAVFDHKPLLVCST
nr:major facilitator superfamily domain protein [Tanacetum cinerariifolium]